MASFILFNLLLIVVLCSLFEFPTIDGGSPPKPIHVGGRHIDLQPPRKTEKISFCRRVMNFFTGRPQEASYERMPDSPGTKEHGTEQPPAYDEINHSESPTSGHRSQQKKSWFERLIGRFSRNRNKAKKENKESNAFGRNTQPALPYQLPLNAAPTNFDNFLHDTPLSSSTPPPYSPPLTAAPTNAFPSSSEEKHYGYPEAHYGYPETHYGYAEKHQYPLAHSTTNPNPEPILESDHTCFNIRDVKMEVFVAPTAIKCSDYIHTTFGRPFGYNPMGFGLFNKYGVPKLLIQLSEALLNPTGEMSKEKIEPFSLLILEDVRDEMEQHYTQLLNPKSVSQAFSLLKSIFYYSSDPLLPSDGKGYDLMMEPCCKYNIKRIFRHISRQKAHTFLYLMDFSRKYLEKQHKMDAELLAQCIVPCLVFREKDFPWQFIVEMIRKSGENFTKWTILGSAMLSKPGRNQIHRRIITKNNMIGKMCLNPEKSDIMMCSPGQIIGNNIEFHAKTMSNLVYQCTTRLLPASRHLLPQNMFRDGGNLALVKDVIANFNKHRYVDWSTMDVHNLGNFLKKALSKAYKPLVPIRCLPKILAVGEKWTVEAELDANIIEMREIFNMIEATSEAHFEIFIDVLVFLHLFCKQSVETRFDSNMNMTPFVLGLLFAPVLMRECDGFCLASKEEIYNQGEIWPKFIEFCITHVPDYVKGHPRLNLKLGDTF